MIMPKKMYLKGNPRKFSDKIALIKQKEALSNASFRSAIHGLPEITMNRIPGNELETLEVKDNYSSNSYSPESFTSESTALSFKTAQPIASEHCEPKTDNLVVNNSNEVFRSCHELSQMNDQRHSYHHDQVKFRHGSDRTQLQTQEARYSNIEGYYAHNKNLRSVFEPVSSGSLPDVSMWRSPTEYTARHSDENKHGRDSMNNDHINLQESLSNLEQVKLTKNSKVALIEHLKNRGIQNLSNVHPHHVQSFNDTSTMGMSNMISSPSLHRASGHVHDHADADCAGNPTESGHLKHYSMLNSPYLSLPHRGRQSYKDIGGGYHQRQMGVAANSSMKYMKLNVNCDTDSDDYRMGNKALTPTGQQSNTWFDNSRNEINTSYLHPSMFSNVLANENGRRVASDSNIQNSLKYQNDRLTLPNNFVDSSFERVNSLRGEQTFHSYQRNQSMTSYPSNNAQSTRSACEAPSPLTNIQRECSQLSMSSSLLDNLLAMKSPDENLDPSLVSETNIFKTPDHNQGQTFVFNNLNNPQDDIGHDNLKLSPFIEKAEYDNSDVEMDCYRKSSVVKNSMNCNDDDDGNIQRFEYSSNNTNNTTNSHDCYWGQSDESDLVCTKEQSPKIKPCEDLDPKNVIVDIYTDFDGISDVPFTDTEAQRRDSLNWTDEVLRNLNSESLNNEISQSRERSMSVYQPMIALTEEEKSLVDVHDN